jgi:hypothetical protein
MRVRKVRVIIVIGRHIYTQVSASVSSSSPSDGRARNSISVAAIRRLPFARSWETLRRRRGRTTVPTMKALLFATTALLAFTSASAGERRGDFRGGSGHRHVQSHSGIGFSGGSSRHGYRHHDRQQWRGHYRPSHYRGHLSYHRGRGHYGYFGPSIYAYGPPYYGYSIYGDVGYGRSGYAGNGALFGALAGAIIGNNSGGLGHSSWRGAAYGTAAGYILGSIADANADRRERTSADEISVARVERASAPPPLTQVSGESPIRVTDSAKQSSSAMSAANGLFGR